MDEKNRNEVVLLPPAHSRPVTELTFPAEGLCADSADNDLLAAAAQGDEIAFRLLVRRYLSKMVMLAQRIVLDRELAQEVAQEAFLRAWQNAPKWDPDGSATFYTWLRRVVVNLSISQRRRRRELVNIDAMENLPDMKANGFDSVASADQKRMVQKALMELPERQRAALALYYFGEASQTESAEAMQMKAKAFDSLLVRARSNLKKYLSSMGFTSNGSIS